MTWVNITIPGRVVEGHLKLFTQC